MAGEQPQTEFGKRLRAARDRRGISLRQISNQTKISMSVLEALENGDPSRLPGGIFARAFVRSYAVEVGLDPDRTVDEFLSHLPLEAAAIAHISADTIEDGEALENARRTATTFMWLVAMSVPIALAVLYFGRGDSSVVVPGPTSAETTSLEPARGAAVAPSGSAATEPTQRSEPTPPLPQPRPAVVAAVDTSAPLPERLTVAITAIRACWIVAAVDGKTVVENLLEPGDTRTLHGGEIVLKIGDATALSITLNGGPARALGKPGEVVTARLNSSNFKDYLQ